MTVAAGRRILAFALSAALNAASGPARSQPAPVEPTSCVGRPSAGVLRNGRQLQARPYLRIKTGSQERVWGHGILLQLVSRGARAAAAAVPGSVLLVGDLSAARGGPLPGHASHQSGRDADVAFLVSDARGLPVTLSEFEPFGSNGQSLVDPDHFFDTYRNWLMLREWLGDLRIVVTHVFVSPELRELLLAYGRASPEFARLVPLAALVFRAHPNHADHFHVRIACPTEQGTSCVDGLAEP